MSSLDLSKNEESLGYPTSLTEIEIAGLSAPYNFADGHAYHSMPSKLTHVIEDMTGLFQEASKSNVPELENRFKQSWAELILSPTLHDHQHFSVCPTASNSIDIVAAWLNTNSLRVGLLEPVFDNLYLILARRRVPLFSINEIDLLDLDSLEWKINKYHIQALFIVDPNNPTGFQLSEFDFKKLCLFCREKKVILIIDKTFRFYSKTQIDHYQIMKDNDLSFVVIEDTGKTWPTQDLKASLILYSKSIAKGIRTHYEEIYLCYSSFALALHTRLVQETARIGLEEIVWNEVRMRKQKVKDILDMTCLLLESESPNCELPLAWVNCAHAVDSDLTLTSYLSNFGIKILPGRYFFWESKIPKYVRISLMKPDVLFSEGLHVLSNALEVFKK